MLQFDAKQLFPRFLLNDRNGAAMVKALMRGIEIYCERVQDGLDTIQNVAKMPEWRLDELAWESDCLYDYNADVETKREWIEKAIPLFAAFGTRQSIYNYLNGYFDDVDVEEANQYGGEPYHFRVTVEGEWNLENEAWARQAIEQAKNVRSVLDSLRAGCRCFMGATMEGQVLGRFGYRLTAGDTMTGQWPQVNTQGVWDEGVRAGVTAEQEGHPFGYPLTGTRPEINTAGVVDDTARAAASAEAAAFSFAYPATGDETRTGTVPQENTLGVNGENTIQAAQAADTYTKIVYKPCGVDEI